MPKTALPLVSCCLLAAQFAAVLFAQDPNGFPPPHPSGLPDVSDLGDVRLGPPPLPHPRPDPVDPTISLTTLKAPKKARKAYQAGLEAAGQLKWSLAEKKFSTAVTLYPNYAPAWDELGRVLNHEHQGRLSIAAFRMAIHADPTYARSYSDLAKLAVDNGDWPLALEMSAGAIRLLAVDDPAIWIYNATAAFKLGEWDTAEKSARAAIERDERHLYPVEEYLLGVALDHRGRVAEARAHYEKFLAMSPAPDSASLIPLVRRRLGELH